MSFANSTSTSSGTWGVFKLSSCHSGTFFWHTDELRYHIKLLRPKTYTTNADNSIASWQEFDVWGTPLKPVHLDLNQKSVDDAVEYTNHNYDKVLGLYYAKARMYDPLAHRFAGRDVARSGRNWYGYVGGNPATKVDPTGLVGGDLLLNGHIIDKRYYREYQTGAYAALRDVVSAMGGEISYNDINVGVDVQNVRLNLNIDGLQNDETRVLTGFAKNASGEIEILERSYFVKVVCIDDEALKIAIINAHIKIRLSN